VAKSMDSYKFFLRSLQRLMDRYEGQYVAIVGGSVAAHGKDAQRVYERARRMHPGARILVGQVPVKEAMILWVECAFLSQDRDQKRSES
jgi:hypothetical protein